jgi:DNA-binding transcriptional ArsR family regulator
MKEAARLFKNLGHPVRLKVLCLLARDGRQCVCRMLPEVGVPQPTLSRHLALLKGGGLIEDEREGTMIFYRIANPLALEILAAAGLACAEKALHSRKRAGLKSKGGRAA